MSDQQASPMTAPPLDDVLASLLHAVDTAARSSTSSADIREVREYGAAALSFAQAWVILHPGMVSPQGVTPEQIAKSVPKPDPVEKRPQPTPGAKS